MTDSKTKPAPAADCSPRSSEQAAFARFGTIGFDLYRAAVLAESERLFTAQAKRP